MKGPWPGAFCTSSTVIFLVARGRYQLFGKKRKSKELALLVSVCDDSGYEFRASFLSL
jgi:hypothetical protein